MAGSTKSMSAPQQSAIAASCWSTNSNGIEAAIVSGESSEYGDMETYWMPGWLNRTNATLFSNHCNGQRSSGVWRGDESTHGRTKVETFKHTCGTFTPATSNVSSPPSRSFLHNYLRADRYPRSVSSLSSGSKTSLQLPRA
ncbi:hypothetical protein D6D22_09905 [Aureobasidium pullulans]|uniref:Uncharacterized protein n=1 Tax=Aureobasidium pullulans TaxID=5580 RepID=A0A4S8X1U3_AURPU|nr:hypothetical protein D6D22_09905 [Aureobasidium pullulans]